MDFLGMLERELDFIKQFYDQTTEPFVAIKRKIDAEEEPYVPLVTGDGDPTYLDEWLNADRIVSTLGLCALGLVENALHKYLRKFAMNELGEYRDKEFSQLFAQFKRPGWFASHEFFLETRGFEWAKSPVQRERLEQVILTRNDIAHDTTLDMVTPARSEQHIKKHSVPIFADETEILMLAGSDELPINIIVTRPTLLAAMDDVWRFCGFVETGRTAW